MRSPALAASHCQRLSAPRARGGVAGGLGCGVPLAQPHPSPRWAPAKPASDPRPSRRRTPLRGGARRAGTGGRRTHPPSCVATPCDRCRRCRRAGPMLGYAGPWRPWPALASTATAAPLHIDRTRRSAARAEWGKDRPCSRRQPRGRQAGPAPPRASAAELSTCALCAAAGRSCDLYTESSSACPPGHQTWVQPCDRCRVSNPDPGYLLPEPGASRLKQA